MSSHTKSARSLHVHASFWLLHFAHRTPKVRTRSLNARNVRTALITHVFNNPITRTASFVRGLPPVCLLDKRPHVARCASVGKVTACPTAVFPPAGSHFNVRTCCTSVVLLVTPRSSLVGWVVWIVFLQRRGVCVSCFTT